MQARSQILGPDGVFQMSQSLALAVQSRIISMDLASFVFKKILRDSGYLPEKNFVGKTGEAPVK